MRPVLRSETAWIPTGNRIIKAVQYKDRTCEFIDNGVVVPTSRYVNVRYVKYDEERGMIYKNGRDLPLIKTE